MTTDMSARDRGAQLLRQGDFAAAARQLEVALADSPADERAWQYLGAALASLKDTGGSLLAFTRSRDLSPQSAKSHYNLALAQQSSGDNTAARASLETALALDPSYLAARDRLNALPPPPAPAPPPTPAMLGLTAVGGGAYAPPPPPVDENGGAGVASTDYSTPTLRAPITPSLAPPPILGQDYSPAVAGMLALTQNTSGMQGSVPDEAARGFNFGAAVLPYLWLLNHQMRPYAYGIYALNYISWRVNGTFYLCVLALQAAAFLILGFKGNTIAWQNRRFDSVEDFRDCQRIWGYWAIPGFIIESILALIFIINTLAPVRD